MLLCWCVHIIIINPITNKQYYHLTKFCNSYFFGGAMFITHCQFNCIFLFTTISPCKHCFHVPYSWSTTQRNVGSTLVSCYGSESWWFEQLYYPPSKCVIDEIIFPHKVFMTLTLKIDDPGSPTCAPDYAGNGESDHRPAFVFFRNEKIRSHVASQSILFICPNFGPTYYK